MKVEDCQVAARLQYDLEKYEMDLKRVDRKSHLLFACVDKFQGTPEFSKAYKEWLLEQKAKVLAELLILGVDIAI